MNILHVIDSAGLYGAEEVLLNLCQDQQKLGLFPVIASIRKKDEHDMPLEEEAHRRGLEILTFRMFDGPNFLGALKILRYVRSNGIDILHSHGYKADILFGFLPRKIRGVPTVSTLHGWTSTVRFSKMAFYEYLDSVSLSNLDAVCLVNRKMFDHPRLRSLRDRLHVIPNGVPSLDATGPVPDDYINHFCSEGFIVCSVGRLSREKGYDQLIRAFSSFSHCVEDARLLIIGEGPDRSKLESLIRERELVTKTLLPGYRPQAWRYLGSCGVFVLSSLTEGLPMTLLEAMRARVPVICTSVGGIPEVLKDSVNGLLVCPGDINGLEDAMLKVYSDEHLARNLAESASDTIANHYSSTAVAQKYVEIYLVARERFEKGL